MCVVLEEGVGDVSGGYDVVKVVDVKANCVDNMLSRVFICVGSRY